MPRVAAREGLRSGIFVAYRSAGGAVSGNVLAAAARRSLQILRWQVACVAALAAVAAALSDARAGWSVLVGGGVGLIWTVYMAGTLYRHSLDHGVRMSALTFMAGWLIKVALTVAVLVVALRSGRRSEEHTSELQSRENIVC